MVVSSEEAIRDVLIHKQDHFSDRPPSLRGDMMIYGKSDVFTKDNEKFRYKKKHMTIALKQYGDGLDNLEKMTLSFGMEMLNEFENYHSNPFDPYEIFRSTIGSIMIALTYGCSNHEDVISYCRVQDRFTAMMAPSGPNVLLDICPSFRFISSSLTAGYNELIEVGNKFEEILGSFVNTRRANRKMNTSKVG